jgi:hypothetical protein
MCDQPQIKIAVITLSKINVMIVPTAAVEFSKKLSDMIPSFFSKV